MERRVLQQFRGLDPDKPGAAGVLLGKLALIDELTADKFLDDAIAELERDLQKDGEQRITR